MNKITTLLLRSREHFRKIPVNSTISSEFGVIKFDVGFR